MSFGQVLSREIRFLTGLLRTLGRVSSIKATSKTLICDDLEAAVDRWSGRLAIRFEGRDMSYAALEVL